jgi:hypothetical protein
MANTFVGDNDHGDAVPNLSDLLEAESQLRQDVIRLTKERDQARREMSSAITRDRLDIESAMRRVNELSRCDPQPSKAFKDLYSMQYANERGWDCFDMITAIENSHKSIITKHNDLFQKLTQEEKTNG